MLPLRLLALVAGVVAAGLELASGLAGVVVVAFGVVPPSQATKAKAIIEAAIRLEREVNVLKAMGNSVIFWQKHRLSTLILNRQY
jgi:hypothetical protein